MQAKPDGAELRILEAAIACIEEFGLKGTTIRRIAAKAGVNTAAINYYFRTKEQLMEKVIELTLHNAFDWDDLQFTENLPPKEQLLAVLEHLAEGAQRYPATARAHFYETMVNGNYNTKAVESMNRFLEILFGKLRDKGCKMAERNLRIAITQAFMIGVFAVGVIPNVFQQFLGEDLTQEEQRNEYLRRLVDRLMVEE